MHTWIGDTGDPRLNAINLVSASTDVALALNAPFLDPALTSEVLIQRALSLEKICGVNLVRSCPRLSYRLTMPSMVQGRLVGFRSINFAQIDSRQANRQNPVYCVDTKLAVEGTLICGELACEHSLVN